MEDINRLFELHSDKMVKEGIKPGSFKWIFENIRYSLELDRDFNLKLGFIHNKSTIKEMILVCCALLYYRNKWQN